MSCPPPPSVEPSPMLLVIDDAPCHLQLATELLRSVGYRVTTASSGELGLQRARAQPRPDLILLDVAMPGLDGHEVLRRLKAEPRTAEIPVLFLSAHDDDADIEHGLALGAVDYLTKPLRPALVLARVRTQLQAARERERLRHRNRRLEARCRAARAAMLLTRKAGLCAMAHLAELRDPETGDHILRTQAYVRQLALQMRRSSTRHEVIDDDWIELLVESAPLHDIGKVGIPDPVLLKPGPLTAEEREVMRTHTTIGARAIERAEQDVGGSLPYFTIARQVALSHHERWDGRGYPQGLAGQDIPLAARIMAVADVFDALVTSRVYKRPLPVAEARRLILADTGTRFDPEVVAAFEAVFERLVAIAQASVGSEPVLPAAA